MHRLRRSRVGGASVLAVSLLVAACGGGGGSEADAGVTAEPAPAPVELLEGEFVTLASTSLDLGDLAGKDTVLWFWAPW